MPDAPTPLDLDAIEAAIAACRTYRFGMYQADRLAHEHAPALVEEVNRLRAEVTIARQHQREASSTIRSVEGLRKERDDALAKVARLRTMVGDCHCDKHHETTNGPEEDCPQHGRPVAEVWGLVERAEAEWDHARAEVDRLRAEVARLTARPAPAWDEEVVVEAVATALHGDGCPEDPDEGESCACSDYLREARIAVAVVREHLPVKPGREDMVEAMLGSDIITDDLRAEASAQGSTQREPFLCFADAVLDLLWEYRRKDGLPTYPTPDAVKRLGGVARDPRDDT